MKKIIIPLLFISNFFLAQIGTITINNFSNYDFHGALGASGLASCYPQVNVYNPQMLIVSSNNSEIINNYNTSSQQGVIQYSVSTSATNYSIRIPTHISLAPSSVISQNTNWSWSKFQMYIANTNTPESYFGGDLANTGMPCLSSWSSYVSTQYGYAEWFTISSGQNMNSYLQIY